MNDFVATREIESIIEFGSGDGAQLGLAKYPRYTGVDVSTTVLEATRRKFADNPSMRFLHTNDVTGADRAELALSLDVIYHLVEDDVFDGYMRQLFNAYPYSKDDADETSFADFYVFKRANPCWS